ncbi:unnamed protein product [Urochloa humidicola]
MAGSPPKSPSPPAPPIPSHPSDTELINSYLQPRLLFPGTTVGDFIHEADLYAADPDHLTDLFSPVTSGDGKKAWYFFTTLKRESGFKHGIKRAVDTGEGRWEEEEGSPQPVLGGRPAGTRQIGLRQVFAFVRKEGAREVRSRWFMVELRVNPSDLLVMCKVYRGPSDDDPKPIDAAAARPTPRLEIWEAGNKDPGAETAAGAAASPGARQKKPVAGEGARPATAREIDAADKGKALAEPQPEELEAPAAYALYRCPTETELIESYLRPWVDDSGKKAGEFIHETDVYADAPDDLTTRFPPAVHRGEEAWYFLTKLRVISASKDRVSVERRVETGKGYWRRSRPQKRVHGGRDGNGPPIGHSQTFAFARMDGKNQVNLGWMMVELRTDLSKPEALCKVYRSAKAPKADGRSPVVAMARAPESKEADDEAASTVGAVSSVVGVVAPRREEDGEEIDSVAAAAELGLKRKPGDQGSGADTAAASPGSQNKAVGESPGAATTGELCVDRRASLDAVMEEVEAPADAVMEEVEAPADAVMEEAEPDEPDDPSKPKLHKFF